MHSSFSYQPGWTNNGMIKWKCLQELVVCMTYDLYVCSNTSVENCSSDLLAGLVCERRWQPMLEYDMLLANFFDIVLSMLDSFKYRSVVKSLMRSNPLPLIYQNRDVIYYCTNKWRQALGTIIHIICNNIGWGRRYELQLFAKI